MYDITNEESFNAVQDWYNTHSFINSFSKLPKNLIYAKCYSKPQTLDESDMAPALKEFSDERSQISKQTMEIAHDVNRYSDEERH
jgi:hypothetical protein